MENTYNDLRFLVSIIYTDLLSVIILIIVNKVIIKNYIGYFLVSEWIYILASLISYIFLFGIRIIWGIMNKENVESIFIKKVNKKFMESINKTAINGSTNFCDDGISGNFTCNKNTTQAKTLKEKSENVFSNSNYIESSINSNNANDDNESKKENIIPNFLLTIYNYHYTTKQSENPVILEKTISNIIIF